MRRVTLLTAGLVVLSCSAAMGQFMVVPGPENTLSVTVVGSAEAPADWAELSLSVPGAGATAQEALATCDTGAQTAMDDLAALQIAPENLRLGPPELGGDPYAQMMAQIPGDDSEQPTHTIHRTLTVRMAPLDAEAVYEWFCQVIDVAAGAGATLPTGDVMSGVLSGNSSPIVFGANDPEPLRAQAIRNGLAAAREAAEVTATSSGRKLGEVAGLQVAELGADQGYMAMIGAMFTKPKPGMAMHSVFLTVTYRLQ